MWPYSTQAIVFMTFGVVVSAGVTLFVWLRRTTTPARNLAWLTTASMLWSLSYLMHLSSARLPAIVFWSRMQYLFTQLTMLAWLVFVLSYTGYERWLTLSRLILIAVVPAATIVVAWTNDWHGLLWQDIRLDTNAPVPGFLFRHGPWYWVNVVYIYLLLLAGAFLLLLSLVRSSNLYRRQVGAILVAVLAPWVANVLYLTGLEIIPGLNLTSLSLTVSGLAFTWSLFRFRFLDIVPVARAVVIETMHDPVIVLDERNRVVDLNPSANRLIEQQESQLIGQPIDAVLAEWDEVVQACQTQRRIRRKIVLRRQDRVLYFDVRVSPLQNRRGRRTGCLLVLHDITEQTRTAEQREQLIVELDAFAHTVAHDLKNPLASIVGYGKLLESRFDNLPPIKIGDFLNIIIQNGVKMSSIIDELLLLATMRHVEDVTRAPLSMAEIVSQVRLRLSGLIQEYQAEIVTPEAWPVATGHGAWVEEVWVNYMSNAIKYGGRPPRVELGATVEDHAVRFWVRDNGNGISPEEQARLFTLFTRLDQVKAEGHGLGLSIVRRIVEKLDGEVGVESEMGRGSTFSFTLPAGVAVDIESQD